MNIKHKINQHRRDFVALFECEHCGDTCEKRGYDDEYFHSTVIPSMACERCGATSPAATSSPDVPAGVVL